MRSFPWDSVATSIGEDGYPVYDRVYQASDLREVYETFFSNGVFTDDENALKVSPGSGMTVKVAPGRCCINGTVGYEHEERTLAITSSGNLDRIDTVVLRWDSSLDARSVDLYVLAGAPADTPVRPTLTRSETVWELGLCDVYVTAHMAQTKAEKMTDTRLETERCGVVAPFVVLNTKNFYDQLQAQTQVAVDMAQAALDGTIVGKLEGDISEVNTKAEGKVSKAGDTMTGALTLNTPLAVASGGTGLKVNPSMLVNLGTTAASSVLAASPRPGVTGTLPVSNGGTGAATAASALINLGASWETGSSWIRLKVGNYAILFQYFTGLTYNSVATLTFAKAFSATPVAVFATPNFVMTDASAQADTTSATTVRVNLYRVGSTTFKGGAYVLAVGKA